MAYTWMQEETARFYVKLDRWLGIFIIILSGIVGTNNFFDATNLSTRQIIFGSISYIVTILGMLVQFLKPMEVSQQRINIGNKFQDIYYDIKQELSKSPNDRKNANEYLENMTQRYIELYDFAPTINKFIINKFKYIFKNSNITMPLSANFIDEIKIFNENRKEEIAIELQPKQKRNNPNEFHDFILSRLNSIN